MKVGSSIVTPLFAFREYNIGSVAVAAQMVVVVNSDAVVVSVL